MEQEKRQRRRTGKAYSLSDEDFRKLVEEATSVTDCCRKLGLCAVGRHGLDAIRRRCEELNISIDHFYTPRGRSKAQQKRRIPLEDILVENSEYVVDMRVKRRLIEEGYLEYKCACCGNTGEWQGKPLTLQLHHINGNHKDNRIENLCILCPNCHTQTDNYGSKNFSKDK